MKLRTLNRLGLVSSMAVAMAGISLVACGSPDASLDADDATAAEIEEQDAVHRHVERGPLGLVELALREDIGLSDAQRTTLLSLRDADTPERHAPPREHVAALAAAIRAGSIDVAALEPEAGPGRDGMHQRASAALDTLHDTLSATQRKKLVKLARERAEDKGERRGPPPGAMAGPGRGFPLIPGVELGDAQRAKIEAALAAKGIKLPAPPDEEEMKARRAEMDGKRDALLDAFVGDDFDAKQALPQPQMMKVRLVEVLAVAVPLLDAEQREAAAVAIEQGPPGPRGHHGPPPVEEEK